MRHSRYPDPLIYPCAAGIVFLVLLAIAGVLFAAPALGAAHPFRLADARRAAVKVERQSGLLPWEHVGPCRWVTPRKAACRITLTAVIISGTDPVTFQWADYVTGRVSGRLLVQSGTLHQVAAAAT